MKKDQLPLIAELALDDDTKDDTTNPARKFAGTDNQRHLRVIPALLTRPRKREEIDRIAGCSNAPDLIAELRRRGLCIPCRKTPGIDRDGHAIKFGVYFFDDADHRKVNAWLRLRDAEGKS